MKSYWERNLEVFQMRQDGYTYKQIAEHFEISLERARQICNRLSKTDMEEVQSEFYQLIVDDAHHSFTVSLYNTLRRTGIDNIPKLQNRIDDINNHPENYVYIGEKGRSYLNSKLASLN